MKLAEAFPWICVLQGNQSYIRNFLRQTLPIDISIGTFQIFHTIFKSSRVCGPMVQERLTEVIVFSAVSYDEEQASRQKAPAMKACMDTMLVPLSQVQP